MIVVPENICAEIQGSLIQSGLYSLEHNDPVKNWRIAAEPYKVSSQDLDFFKKLGGILLEFYSALNSLYLESYKGKAPEWVADYLDRGKPSDLVEYSRMKKFKNILPGIIRPDIMVKEKGFAVTELDSVPGGFGLTAHLMKAYSNHGWEICGSENDITESFFKMLGNSSNVTNPTVAIIVSDEAVDYLAEMEFLSKELRKKERKVYVLQPRQVIFSEEGLFFENEGKKVCIDIVYRFFELFDLKNIPKSELFMYSNKKGKINTTPPYKPYLEEKLNFALFHHPALSVWWEKHLKSETFETLNHLIPKSWILDNRPLPPQGVIPNLKLRNKAVQDWAELSSLSQKERELVIKPSGFSPEAWGSRGVTIGHDVSSEIWQETLSESLDRFESQPYILQEFHKGKRIQMSYWDPQTDTMEEMQGRVRLTPYYFIVNQEAQLGGILATICPQDKKKIHGMVDAIMVPCAVEN